MRDHSIYSEYPGFDHISQVYHRSDEIFRYLANFAKNPQKKPRAKIKDVRSLLRSTQTETIRAYIISLITVIKNDALHATH